MTRLILALAGAMAISSAGAQVKAPDFAYPKTVAANAEKTLKAAQSRGDAVGELRALMELTVARSLVDRASRQKSYEQVLEAANRQKDKQMKALFQLYASEVADNIYSNNRWQFNRRSMPLAPRPKDMSEWSGEMFRTVIDSLVREAWANAGAMPIGKLEQVVSANKLTRQYYPTLRDFVGSEISGNNSVSDTLKQRVTKEWAANQTEGTAPYYLLTAKQIRNEGLDMDQTRERMLKAFEDANDKYNALVLWQYINVPIPIDSNTEKYYTALQQAQTVAKDSWAENMIWNKIAQIRNPAVNVASEEIPTAGVPFKVKLSKLSNISNLELKFHRFVTRDDFENSAFNGRTKAPTKPVETITKTVNMGPASALSKDTTISMTLPAGYYALRSYAGADKLTGDCSFAVNNTQVEYFRAGERSYIMVYDAVSGETCPGAVVTVKGRVKDKNGVFRSSTRNYTVGKDGYVEVPDIIGSDITVKWKGQTSNISGMYLATRRPASKNDMERVTVQFTTDLGVYHPGDTVRWLAIASKADKMADGTRIDVSFRGRDMKEQTMTGTTDSFGRLSGTFAIPADVQTGQYDLSARYTADNGQNWAGGTSVEVSDFKAQQARITDLVAWPRYNGTDSVRVSGRVSTFSGMGLGGATVSTSVQQGDSVCEVQTLTGEDGNFELKWSIGPREKEAPRWMQASGVQLRAVTADGSSVEASTWYDPYYPDRMSVKIAPAFGQGYVNDWLPTDKAAKITVKVTDPANKAVDMPLVLTVLTEKDSVVTRRHFDKSGDLELNLGGIRPGVYKLKVQTADTLMAMPSEMRTIIYNPAAAELPTGFMKVMNETATTAAGTSEVTLRIGTDAPGAWVNFSYLTKDGTVRFSRQYVKGGFHDVKVSIADMNADNRRLQISSYLNGDYTVQTITTELRKPAELSLKIESFRDKVTSGDSESWTLKAVDASGKGVATALMMDVYDTRLDALGRPGGIYLANNAWWLRATMRTLYSAQYKSRFSAGFSKRLKTKAETWINAPEWLFTFGYGSVRYSDSNFATAVGAVQELAVMDEVMPGVMIRGTARSAKAMKVESAADTDEAYSLDSEKGDAGQGDDMSMPNVVLRQGEHYSALWLPVAETAADGMRKINVDVPNSNTTWRVKAYAWTRNKEFASLDTTFTSAKAVMTSINAPRYVRYGDRVVVLANVLNNTDNAADINVSMTGANGAGADIAQSTQTISLPANGSGTVQLSVDVTGRHFAVGDTLMLTVRAINGHFSDGERIALPVLESQTRVVNAENFYLNPGDTIWSRKIDRSLGSDFSARLEFTDNPMWTVVEALKVQSRSESWPTANGQTAVYFTNAVALGLMKEHPELELQFNRRELERAMKGAVKQLVGLQAADGGLCWGPWQNRSSEWVTEAVLDNLAVLKRMGYLGNDSEMRSLIEKAVRYLDNRVKDTNMVYTMLRPAFSNVANSVNGEKVANATIQSIIKNWKKYGIGQKAEAASTLWYNNNRNMARTLMGSLDQFGTLTRSKGFQFKNVTSLQVYAWLLEAYGTVDPKSERVDGLRQYLIVRKQASDWGTSVVTSDVIQAMITSGTPWAVAATTPTVTVDGQQVAVKPEGKTGAFSTDVNGSSVTVSRPAEAKTPAYGALVSTFTSPMTEVKAYSDGEVYIDKQMYVMRDGKWQTLKNGGTLKVGDRVKVQIILKSDRPMNQVVVTDQRPATFEPAVQLSGWVWGDGVSAYRENRNSATNLYIDYLPRGTNMLSYEMNVNNAGRFSSGIATVSCSRAPSLTAHSGGMQLSVAPQSK